MHGCLCLARQLARNAAVPDVATREASPRGKAGGGFSTLVPVEVGGWPAIPPEHAVNDQGGVVLPPQGLTDLEVHDLINLLLKRKSV